MNTLFYSEKCKHSSKLMSMIQNNNYLKNNFAFEDVLLSNHEALRSVRSVPTIFLVESKQLISGRDAFNYIESQLDLHLNAFEDYSTFSFISSPEDLGNVRSEYAYLTSDGGYDVPNSMNNDKQNNSSNSGQSSKEKEQNSAFDAFMEKRKNDIPQPIKRV